MLIGDKIIIKVILVLLCILAIALLGGCTSYESTFNYESKLENKTDKVKVSKACSKNLFGGFKFPYVGDTAIRFSGSEAVVDAIVKGKITKVYSIDKSKKHYIFYSRRCTIVYGE